MAHAAKGDSHLNMLTFLAQPDRSVLVLARCRNRPAACVSALKSTPVSYTHLTLPTICSV
eukprot:3782262-Rhodomonas_salina.1